MRYWDTRTGKRPPRKRSGTKRKGSIASGGRLKNSPFLRKFYQHHAEISEGLQKFFFFLILATLIYTFVLGDGGAIRIFILKKKQAALEENLTSLRKQAALLERDIGLLETDPFFMEKLGREKYGYIRPGDKVYKIVPRSGEETPEKR
jgi:cell division protein FtsB